MKSVVALLLLAGAVQANAMIPASPIVCKVPNVEDSSMMVTVTPMGNLRYDVELFVPTGETTGLVYKGRCTPVIGSDEFAVSCKLRSSMESGYDITVASTGSPELVATVTPWTMSNKEQSITLPCN